MGTTNGRPFVLFLVRLSLHANTFHFFFKYHLQSLQQQQQQQKQATEILQKTEIIRGREGEGARRERERGDRSIESYVENSNNKNGLCRRRRRQRSWLPLGVEQKCKSIEVKFGDVV